MSCNESNTTFKYQAGELSDYWFEIVGLICAYFGHILFIIILVRLKVGTNLLTFNFTN